MSARAIKAIDRLAAEFAHETPGENPSREELLAMAFLELREENRMLRQQIGGSAAPRVSRADGFVTLKEASFDVGVSVEWLRRLAARAEIDSVFQDRRWLVRLDDVKAKYLRK
jgi:hypothetical protein